MELHDVKVNYSEEFIKENLAKGIVEFKYRKVDGSERTARGTRNFDKLNEFGVVLKEGTPKTGAITYYDVDSAGWRSFKPENFLGFTTVLAA
jgi:hypothetical protein